MDSFIQDLRYAVRASMRAPGFTAVAIVALAIGIGANTAIFTLVDATLLEPLPFKDPDRLVTIWEENSRRPGRPNTVAPANFIRWGERATAFEALAAFADTPSTLTGGGEPVEVVVQNVTASFFSALAVPALIGRTFSDAENRDPKSAAVVLAYDFWQRRFGGDPAVVGRSITLDAKPATIVGVMPRGFGLFYRTRSLVGKPADLWSPWVLPASAREPRGRFMSVVARLNRGVSLPQAQAQMSAIAAELAIELPKFDTNWSTQVIPLSRELTREYRPALLVLFGAVAFVLLIACANVANLLLARGSARQREFAVRAALGAGRGRLVRQVLTETLLLSGLGAGAGLLLATWMLAALSSLSPIESGTATPLRLDGEVLGFTIVAAILTAMLAGLAPALESARRDMAGGVNDSPRQVGAGVSTRRWRNGLIAAEVALALVLLIGAGLLLRSFSAMRAVDPGIDVSNVLTARVQLPKAKYPADADALRFFSAVVERVRVQPGVRDAGMISFLPFAGLGAGTNFTIEGQPPPAPGHDYGVTVSVCDDGYFRTMKLPLIAGRLFTDREMRERSDVVIVNQTFAQRYFPNGDAIGKRLVINMTDPNVPTQIIGIVGDAHFVDLTSAVEPQSYWPHPQLPYSRMTLTVRTDGEPTRFAPTLARTVQEIDKDQPLADVRSMAQWVARSTAQARFSSTLLGVFASIALLLAAVGLYAVIAYVVTQRTGEIGVRLALGADRRAIVRMVIADGMKITAIGIGIGAVAAAALTRALSTLLFATRATDPATFAAVIALLACAALLASYLPARRAARIEPVQALRYQ